MSVPMTLSDLERPDVRNHFFQADLNNAGYVSHVIAFAQMRRAVCQRQPSFLLAPAVSRLASPVPAAVANAQCGLCAQKAIQPA